MTWCRRGAASLYLREFDQKALSISVLEGSPDRGCAPGIGLECLTNLSCFPCESIRPLLFVYCLSSGGFYFVGNRPDEAAQLAGDGCYD